ncbi:hypothetical protein D3C75_1236290 [compost metagenome]
MLIVDAVVTATDAADADKGAEAVNGAAPMDKRSSRAAAGILTLLIAVHFLLLVLLAVLLLPTLVLVFSLR